MNNLFLAAPLLWCSLGLAIINSVFAQECHAGEDASVRTKYLFSSNSLPDVHAANLLDIESNRVIRPSALQDLSLQLGQISNLISGANGGFGIEFNPYLMYMKDRPSANLSKAWSGLTVSLATSLNNGVSRQAFGLKYSYVDSGLSDSKKVYDSLINAKFNVLFSIYRTAAHHRESLSRRIFQLLTQPGQKINEDSIPRACLYRVEEAIDATFRMNGIGADRMYSTIQQWRRKSYDKVREFLNHPEINNLKVDSNCNCSIHTSDTKVLTSLIVRELDKYFDDLADSLESSVIDIHTLQDRIAETNWTRPCLSFGVGTVGIRDSGQAAALSTSRLDYATFYANYVGELSEGSAIVCIQLRGLWGGETVLDRRPASSFQGLTQLVFGSNIMRGLVQLSWDFLRYGAAYVGTPNAPATANNVARAEAGLECRVGSDLWLYATGGLRWTDGQAGRMITDIGVRFSPTIATATFGQLVGGR